MTFGRGVFDFSLSLGWFLNANPWSTALLKTIVGCRHSGSCLTIICASILHVSLALFHCHTALIGSSGVTLVSSWRWDRLHFASGSLHHFEPVRHATQDRHLFVSPPPFSSSTVDIGKALEPLESHLVTHPIIPPLPVTPPQRQRIGEPLMFVQLLSAHAPHHTSLSHLFLICLAPSFIVTRVVLLEKPHSS
jgi:hypothetical protein